MKEERRNLDREEILDPELEICDPHHHLWNYPNNRYMTSDLLDDLGSGHNVTKTVYMECGSMYKTSGPLAFRPIGETEFAHNVAESANTDIRVCAAIISFADLTNDAIAEILDDHGRASDRFTGVRHANAWDHDDQIRNAHTNPTKKLFSDNKFRSGIAELGKRNLVFDAWLYHPQIPELTELASAFCEQTIVLDHLGGPLGIGPYAGQRQEVFNYWKSKIEKLAELPNVFAKLGGLVMPINGFGFHKNDRPPTSQEVADVTRDYYMFMIDKFGTERCMFESNFPVDKVSCSYDVLWNSFKRLTSSFSSTEKSALFHDTAAKVYQIE